MSDDQEEKRGFDPVSSAYRSLQQRGRLHTITLRYPKELALALNRSADVEGEATHQQIDTWLRDVVAMNVEAMIQEFIPQAMPKPKLKAKVKRT